MSTTSATRSDYSYKRQSQMSRATDMASQASRNSSAPSEKAAPSQTGQVRKSGPSHLGRNLDVRA